MNPMKSQTVVAGAMCVLRFFRRTIARGRRDASYPDDLRQWQRREHHHEQRRANRCATTATDSCPPSFRATPAARLVSRMAMLKVAGGSVATQSL
jgi:hypothetical protein